MKVRKSEKNVLSKKRKVTFALEKKKLEKEEENNDEEPTEYVETLKEIQALPFQLNSAYARTNLESLSLLDVESSSYPFRLTNIIATACPSQPENLIGEMIRAGCGIIRINISHGTHESNKKLIEKVRKEEEAQNVSICVAMDTRGLEIRTGTFKKELGDSIKLNKGKNITITTNEAYKNICDETYLYVNNPGVIREVEVGEKILIDKDKIELIVKEKNNNLLTCQLLKDGELKNNRRVKIPSEKSIVKNITESEKLDLKFALENKVDALFATSISSFEMVKQLRKILGEKGKNIKIFAKIENKEGIRNIDQILKVSDGVIISRSELALDFSPQKIIFAQKKIISRALISGKPIICSNFLENMERKQVPTSAETSDIANAILDGVDSIMLTTETTQGKWSIQCIEVINSIAKEAECALFHTRLFDELRLLDPHPSDIPKATAIMAVEFSVLSLAACIIVFTSTGRGIFSISSYKPRCPIIVVTRKENALRLLRLYRGVIPLHYKDKRIPNFEEDLENRYKFALKYAEERGLVKEEDHVVYVHGNTPGNSCVDNVELRQYQVK